MPYKIVSDSFHTGIMAEALRAKIDNFALTWSLWSKISGTTLPLTVFTQRNLVADFLQAKFDFLRKSAVLRFSDPPLGDLGATYDDHLTLIGKRVVHFLLALI